MIVFSHFVLALLVGLIVMCLAVSISDYRFRRIPNSYLLAGVVYVLLVFIAMAFYVPVSNLLRGFMMNIFGLVLGVMFLLPPYLAKQLAGGDVKLGMVIGFFLGPKGAILSVLLGAMVGGVWALVLAWQIGGLNHLWYNLKFMARSAYLSSFRDMGWDLQSPGAIKMPYGVALSAGAIFIAVEQFVIHYQKIQAL